MPTSQNGWPAGRDLDIVPLIVDGVPFPSGVLAGDVHTVLSYVANRLHKEVEPIMHEPGCWGYYYKPNTNDPSSLSNHSSGTAFDYNAPKHPNGVPTLRTWTVAQVNKIMKILSDIRDLVRWGGTYTRIPDSMHFEIVGTPAQIAELAEWIRNQEEEVTPEQITQIVDRVSVKVFDAMVEAVAENKLDVGKTHKWSDDTVAQSLLETLRRIEGKLDELLT